MFSPGSCSVNDVVVSCQTQVKMFRRRREAVPFSRIRFVGSFVPGGAELELRALVSGCRFVPAVGLEFRARQVGLISAARKYVPLSIDCRPDPGFCQIAVNRLLWQGPAFSSSSNFTTSLADYDMRSWPCQLP
jgi:hypothetical protein